MDAFAKRLRYLRKINDVTQQELVNYLNVGKTTISNYETGYSTDAETQHDSRFLIQALTTF